jgi:hypothetical protein
MRIRVVVVGLMRFECDGVLDRRLAKNAGEAKRKQSRDYAGQHAA